MTPKDRMALVQYSNVLVGVTRFLGNQAIPIEDVSAMVAGANGHEDEESVYIKISHLAALEMAMTLRAIAIDDRILEEAWNAGSNSADE